MKYLEPQHMLGLRVMSKKGLDAYEKLLFVPPKDLVRDILSEWVDEITKPQK